MTSGKPPTQTKKRDAVVSKARILKAATKEFADKGYGSARIENIAKRAKCNIRMPYHYFGGKEKLYLACLESVYSNIRHEERQLELDSSNPKQALESLIKFTFDYMREHPEFVQIANTENTQQGKYIGKISPIAKAASDLIDTIDSILRRGAEDKIFKKRIDPFQLYISILSMSYLHLSNRYTLSKTYGRNMTADQWLDDRRKHVCDMVMAYVSIKS